MTDGIGSELRRAPSPCTSCGSDRVSPILYGESPPPETWLELYGRDDFVIGGCVIGPDSRAWRCKACRAEFGPLEERAPELFRIDHREELKQ